MKSMIQQHSRLFINPAFIVVFTPVLWIGLFLLTKSFFGTIYLHFWIGMMTTSFALFNDKDIREDWTILVTSQTLFYIALVEVLLYMRVIF